jgi:hypothetical protein
LAACKAAEVRALMIMLGNRGQDVDGQFSRMRIIDGYELHA